MDQKWIRAARELRIRLGVELGDDLGHVGAAISIPKDLRDDEISIHRALDGSTRGCWLIWTERGPLICRRTRNGWVVGPDPLLCELHPDNGRSLKRWFDSHPILKSPFSTRREAAVMIRSALAAKPALTGITEPA